MISLPEGTKICKACGQPKPLSQFYIDARYGRLRAKCNACHSAQVARNTAERQDRVKGCQRRIPLVLNDNTVAWTEMPEGWAITKAERQADVATSIKALLAADVECRVWLLVPTARITLPAAVAQGDVDWIVCRLNASSRTDILESLVEQIEAIPEHLRPAFFAFDSVGLIPVHERTWAQVPELLEVVG